MARDKKLKKSEPQIVKAEQRKFKSEKVKIKESNRDLINALDTSNAKGTSKRIKRPILNTKNIDLAQIAAEKNEKLKNVYPQRASARAAASNTPAKKKSVIPLVAKKEKVDFNLDLNQFAIVLNDKSDREYLKYMGIVSVERIELFSSNLRYKYLLELGCNLDYIASSILSGELDRMTMTELKTGLEEICYYVIKNGLIFVLYGSFPQKKADWLLSQQNFHVQELLRDRNPSSLDKIAQYELNKNYKIRANSMLKEYIKLQSVFTENVIKSIDNFLRIDYFGLSYESIGVLSMLITDVLKIEGLPPIEEEAELLDMKESLITAKIEAIAANTVANTQMMPKWITIKLGFQQYRYLFFAEVNKYYFYLLGEGNLKFYPEVLENLTNLLKDVSNAPFVGDLKRFTEAKSIIKNYIQEFNAQFEK